jgi:hypothetical protein
VADSEILGFECGGPCIVNRFHGNRRGLPEETGGNEEIPPFCVLSVEPSTPIVAVLLTGLAGLFLFVEGLVDLFVGVEFASLGGWPEAGGAALLGIASLVLGLVMAALAFTLHKLRWQHALLGVLITVFALVSQIAGGGFLFGAALGIGGGVLAIAWAPTPPFYVAPTGRRMCPQCGSVQTATQPVCDVCDMPLGAWAPGPWINEGGSESSEE